MELSVYFIALVTVLFLSYRISLVRAYLLCIAVSIFFIIDKTTASIYEKTVFLLFINSIPAVTEFFKKDFNLHKERMRESFDKVKSAYEGLLSNDKQQTEINLAREKKLQQVLTLYEISKDMSGCLTFEDIFNIFSSVLKRSFRFRISRIVLLKDSNEIYAVHQIELGQKINRSAPSNFDKELVAIALESGRQTVSISSHEESAFSRRLAIIKDFDSLVSVPLSVEGKIAGVLYIENLPAIYFENFIILSAQFAIQLQKVMLYKKVQEISITDSLTEVYTRRYFMERFLEELRRSMRHKSNLSFLILDIDYFKETNDRFGHLVGDVVLKEVAGILKSNLREMDVIGRYGGEEFAIVLTGIGRGGAVEVAERVRENIKATIFRAYDEDVSVTVSIGVSVFPDDGADVNSLIESADSALYKAKESGRNRVCA